MKLTFRSLSEEAPGAAWQQVFDLGWPGWRAWYRQRRTADAPRLAASEAALRAHMPDLAPVWARLVAAVGADAEAATFLTFWTPPRYLGTCSQAVTSEGAPALLRNYDLDPRLNEATLLRTVWCRPVMGMVEGLWGLSDGINGDGLCVSLAYGGRRQVGAGFGVPLVVRYLLETCADVPEAVAALRRLPHHMSYNLLLLDRAGARANAMIAPDRPLVIGREGFATNHQGRVEDARHAAFCNTLGRAGHLRGLLKQGVGRDALAAAFQAGPLHTTEYEAGFGTVFTAAYEPEAGAVALLWPGQPEWRQTLDAFREETREVTYLAAPAADAFDWMQYVPPEVRRWVRLGPEAG
jgi:predicted choloylglycine hydrolase